MPDVDLILEQPVTGETAWVQVKTASTQAELTDYISRFRSDGSCTRFYFACASAKGTLSLPSGSDASLCIWTGSGLADQAINAGLFGWLADRTR